jgi:hypothetical protein
VIVVAIILKATGVANGVIGAFILSALADTTGDIVGLLTSAFATPIVGIPAGLAAGAATIGMAKKILG